MLSPVAADVEGYNHVVYFFLVVAAIMTVMGFLGCCGAMQESQCMLGTFFTLVLILCAGQVVAGVWFYQYHDEFQEVVEKSTASSIQYDYGRQGKEVKTKAFDVLQRQLKCCGASGPSDWADAHYNNMDDSKSKFEVGVGKLTGIYKVPASCCRVGISETQCETARSLSLAAVLSQSIYDEGCASKMITLIKEHDYVALAIILAILLTEVMAMVFSLILCCAVRRMDQFKA